MSFFKRLKEKLTGGNEELEQKVDQPELDEQQLADNLQPKLIEETAIKNSVEQEAVEGDVSHVEDSTPHEEPSLSDSDTA